MSTANLPSSSTPALNSDPVHAALIRITTDIPTLLLDTTASDDALRLERAAESRLLEGALTMIRPLLHHVTRPIAMRWSGACVGGLRGVEEAEYFPLRGLVLVGTLRDDEGGYNDTRGRISGEALVLCRDGTLAAVETRGYWSRWENDRPSLERTTKVVSPAQAMECWELEPALEALAKATAALTRANLSSRAQRCHARAAQLDAALALLAGKQRPAA